MTAPNTTRAEDAREAGQARKRAMTLSAMHYRQMLEAMTDDELQWLMAEVSGLIRRRERTRGEEFKQALRRACPEFFGTTSSGGRT